MMLPLNILTDWVLKVQTTIWTNRMIVSMFFSAAMAWVCVDDATHNLEKLLIIILCIAWHSQKQLHSHYSYILFFSLSFKCTVIFNPIAKIEEKLSQHGRCLGKILKCNGWNANEYSNAIQGIQEINCLHAGSWCALGECHSLMKSYLWSGWTMDISYKSEYSSQVKISFQIKNQILNRKKFNFK